MRIDRRRWNRTLLPVLEELRAMGGQVYLSVRFYLYGEAAPTAVARAQSVWQDWLNRQFAPAGAG